MSTSFSYHGIVAMKPEKEVAGEYACSLGEPYDKYPYRIPNIYLDGWVEDYPRNRLYTAGENSTILVYGGKIIKYNRLISTECKAKDENGNIIWVGREDIPEGIEYLDAYRDREEYEIEEFSLSKAEKKKYKVTLDEVSTMDGADFESVAKFVRMGADNENVT
jgi:hypothetical protein